MAAISKQLEELLLLLRSKHSERENLQVDSIPTSPQLPESPDFNRPDPKPNYVINATADVTKASSPLSNRTIKCHRKISLEEIEERRLKGLCMFCEELETPDHHLLHKKSGLLVVECEDLGEREVEVENDAEIKSIDKMASQLQLQEDLQSPDVLLEEKSVPQFQVPIANSEILKSIESEEVDLGLENLEYVVMNENIEQEWVQRNVDKRFEVDGVVKRDQKVTSNTKLGSTHQMLDKMSQHKERLGIKKKRKGFKSWMFKYKRRYKKLHAFTFSKNMRMVVSQQIEMVETSSDLLLLSDNDSLAQSAMGSKLETDLSNQERSDLCTENKENEVEVDVGIQEQVANHSMNSVPEAIWVPHMCSFLKHQLTNGRRKTFLKTWRFKFKDTAPPRELIQEKLCVHEAKVTRNQLRSPIGIVDDLHSDCGSDIWCVQYLVNSIVVGDLQETLWLFNDELEDIQKLQIVIKESNAGQEQQAVCEQVIMVNVWLNQISLVLQQVMRNKRIKLSKRWWFKYRFDEEDQGSLQSRAGYSLSRGEMLTLISQAKALLFESKDWREKQIPTLQINVSQYRWIQEEPSVICFLIRRHLYLNLDCEAPELVGRKRNHGFLFQLHSKQKQRKYPKCWMFKFRKKKIDQRLGYDVIDTYLENKKTWTKWRVMKHDNLSWKEEASDKIRSRLSRCIVEVDIKEDNQKQQGGLGHSSLIIAAANWSSQMHIWSAGYQVWHRWKARCF